MAEVKKKPKSESGVILCGYCGMAPKMQGGTDVGHAMCYPTDGKNFHCACAANNHKLSPAIAKYMAGYCHLPVDGVYARHNRKRRVLSAEQRVAAGERLAKARAAKTTKREEVA